MDRSYVSGILNKRVEAYLLEAQKDLKITDANIHDQTLLRSSYGCKWTRYEFEEEKYYKSLKQKLDDIIELVKENLYNQKGQSIIDGTANDALIKTKALVVAKKSKEFQDCQKEIEEQEEVIRCIGEVKKLIYQMTYDITNVRSIMAMEQ